MMVMGKHHAGMHVLHIACFFTVSELLETFTSWVVWLPLSQVYNYLLESSLLILMDLY